MDGGKAVSKEESTDKVSVGNVLTFEISFIQHLQIRKTSLNFSRCQTMIKIHLAAALRLLQFFRSSTSIATKMTKERQPSTIRQHLNGVTPAFQKVGNTSDIPHARIKIGHVVAIPGSYFLPKVLMEHIDFGRFLTCLSLVTSTGGLTIYLLKDALRVKHAAVNLVWIEVAGADEEYLSTLTSAGAGLDSLDLFEELLGHPEVSRVVSAAIELTDKGAARLEVLCGAFEGVERQFVLVIGIAVVGGTYWIFVCIRLDIVCLLNNLDTFRPFNPFNTI